jgi:hypothetical protein
LREPQRSREREMDMAQRCRALRADDRGRDPEPRRYDRWKTGWAAG